MLPSQCLQATHSLGGLKGGSNRFKGMRPCESKWACHPCAAAKGKATCFILHKWTTALHCFDSGGTTKSQYALPSILTLSAWDSVPSHPRLPLWGVLRICHHPWSSAQMLPSTEHARLVVHRNEASSHLPILALEKNCESSNQFSPRYRPAISWSEIRNLNQNIKNMKLKQRWLMPGPYPQHRLQSRWHGQVMELDDLFLEQSCEAAKQSQTKLDCQKCWPCQSSGL